MAPRPTKKSPGSTTPQPPPRPDLPVQARHPPPPGLPATAPRPTAVVGRVAELMGGRPEALHGVDVHLAEAVPVVVPRVLAAGVADYPVAVAPVLQPAVDVVLVGVHQGAFRDAPLDDGPDRHLPDVGERAQDDLAAPLEQAEDRRLVLRQGPPAGGTPQPPASGGPPPLATAAGWPLWPATT